jgi:RimJ/RimL family protein N-acetyltransferase
MSDLSHIASRYPRHVTLSGGRAAELRLMTPADAAAVLAFAGTLPPEEVMYLAVNFTEPAVVRHWLETIKSGRAMTVLARIGDEVVGEGTLLHNVTTWTRHLGEIRIQVAPAARRDGLGRVLADELEAIAKGLGLQMLTARMILDQVAAQSVFKRLGFQREAVLWDYAMTPDGETRTVVVATKILEDETRG